MLVATQTLRHEMLFEIALNGIVDGYRREAISSFAASVERFYEFSLRVLARNRQLSSEVFDSAWKVVAVQSERQLGAFVFLYAACFGELPCLLSNDMVALRNEVIHRGALPDQAKVLKFGAASYEVIQSGIRKLRLNCLDDVNAALVAHVSEIAAKMTGYPRAFQVTPTALNVITDTATGFPPFGQILARYGISA